MAIPIVIAIAIALWIDPATRACERTIAIPMPIAIGIAIGIGIGIGAIDRAMKSVLLAEQ